MGYIPFKKWKVKGGIGLVKYKKGRFLTAVVDICQSREEFTKDLHEAFSEIEKWRADNTHSPPSMTEEDDFKMTYEKISPE